MNNIVCVYHSADLDGICSAAIVNMAFRNLEVEFIGWNYGEPIPWDRLEGNQVIMVDLCFQPFSEMIKLKECAASLVWIDHHISAIEESMKHSFDTDGTRDDLCSACELTWEYFTEEQTPEAVKLLSLYDSWNWKEEKKDYQERILNFQYGIRTLGLTPQDSRWNTLFSLSRQNFIEYMVNNGSVIRNYEKVQSERAIKSLGFEADFMGFRAICVNRGGIGSQFFDSVWDQEKYDLMIPFVYKGGKYTVSFYSDNPEVDCSEIAKIFGGGGHVGAAGMQVDTDELFGLFSNIKQLKG